MPFSLKGKCIYITQWINVPCLRKFTVKRCPVCVEALLTGKTKGLMVFIVCVFFFYKAGRLYKGTSRVAIVKKRLGPKCTD